MILVDNDDPLASAYRDMALPDSWAILTNPRGPLSELYNRAFKANPDLRWYGFLADDVVPETPGFDRLLIATAGRDGMAVPAGGETTGGAPHFVLGGDLVRSVGWLALPGLKRLYIDTVWVDIARARGVLRYRPDVTLRHDHFSNGKALFDATYRKPRGDRAIYDAWRKTQ